MTATQVGTFYIYESVGTDPPAASRVGKFEIYENVGVLAPTTHGAWFYLYEGDVDTSTPTPHLWFVKPSSGRPGDGITIYGHGVGATQPTYSGVVQFLESDGVTWTNVSATSWTFVAAGAHAYDSLREIDPDLLIITVEHEEVAIVIPSDAVPPGHRLRFRTDGP